MQEKRILSGMRPTGKLHIGHYVGALENWIKLQDDYESFHLIADYHVLTTDLNTDDVYQNTIEMLIDWLASRGQQNDRAFEFVEVVKVVVNREYVENDHPVKNDDEVFFFPPIAGG